MKNTRNLLGVLAAIAVPWTNSAPAQSTPSQPCVWRNVVMGGGSFYVRQLQHR